MNICMRIWVYFEMINNLSNDLFCILNTSWEYRNVILVINLKYFGIQTNKNNKVTKIVFITFSKHLEILSSLNGFEK